MERLLPVLEGIHDSPPLTYLGRDDGDLYSRRTPPFMETHNDINLECISRFAMGIFRKKELVSTLQVRGCGGGYSTTKERKRRNTLEELHEEVQGDMQEVPLVIAIDVLSQWSPINEVVQSVRVLSQRCPT